MTMLITLSIVLVLVIILLFVGFKWVKPESLRLKVYKWFEFEMCGQDKPMKVSATTANPTQTKTTPTPAHRHFPTRTTSTLPKIKTTQNSKHSGQ